MVQALGETADGRILGQYLDLSGDNRVNRIRFPSGAPLNISYNDQGNPTLLDWGDRTMACEYDTIGRLIRVDDSANGVSEYAYAPNEPDIRKQNDQRTAAAIGHQRRVSSSTLSLSSSHYARPNGTPWAALNWNPGLQIYDLPDELGLIAPNNTQKSSEQRRRFYNALATDVKYQEAFDKASNSFFLPPEYKTVNCLWENCWLGGFGLTVPATVVTNQTFDIEGELWGAGTTCFARIFDIYSNGTWIGGGTTTSFDMTDQHAFTQPGNYQIMMRVTCPCEGPEQIRTAYVLAEDPCSGNALDQFAVDWLKPKALRQYERGTSIYCSGNTLQERATVPSKQGPDDDKCTFDLESVRQPSDVGWMHLHPLFVWNPQSNVTLNCGGRAVRLWVQNDVDRENGTANFFSPEDEEISSSNYPGYLKGPDDKVRKCTGVNCTP